LSQSPVSRLIFASLACAEYGWRGQDLVAVAKTGLCDLSVEEIDAFERYVDLWHLRGKSAFSDERDWMRNPAGYTGRPMESRESNLLALCNNAKNKISSPLIAFCDTITGEKPVRVFAQAISRLLSDYGVRDRLSEITKELEKKGAADEAARNRQVWETVTDSLTQLVDILGDEPCTVSEFTRLYRRVLLSSDIGSIPSSVDEVLLGSANKLRPDRVKHVILLGTNEEEFPAQISESGYFSEIDREKLEEADILLSGKTETESRMELFWFYNSLAKASDSVTVFYKKNDLAGEQLFPSSGVNQILRLFPSCKDHLAMTVSERIFDLASAKDFLREHPEYAESLREEIPDLPDFSPKQQVTALSAKIDESTAAEIYPKEILLSPSSISRFLGCPFSYHCKSILNLSEDTGYEISANNAGSYIHGILETYFSNLKKPYPTGEELEKRVKDCAVRHEESLLQGEPVTPRLQSLFRKLEKASLLLVKTLTEEFNISGFKPVAFEQRIDFIDPNKSRNGDGNDASVIPSVKVELPESKNVYIKGIIDRLDVFHHEGKNYIRIVDYKTGEKDYHSLSQASLLEKGNELQMPLYLISVCEMPEGEAKKKITGDGENVAAAMTYFNIALEKWETKGQTDEEWVSRNLRNKQMSGMYRDDPAVLAAIDPEGKGQYLPSLSKNVKPENEKNKRLTKEELDALLEGVKSKVAEAGSDMLKGVSHATPPKNPNDENNPCKY
ncbi:MAG: PD-(D/E)XK nuclease family protein, partial [Clostridia bacterium]|nr:PD-(D/E)XK nuclease family protein [Clostridia bacterium]